MPFSRTDFTHLAKIDRQTARATPFQSDESTHLLCDTILSTSVTQQCLKTMMYAPPQTIKRALMVHQIRAQSTRATHSKLTYTPWAKYIGQPLSMHVLLLGHHTHFVSQCIPFFSSEIYKCRISTASGRRNDYGNDYRSTISG